MSDFLKGASFMLQGAKLLLHPKLRMLILIPFVVNFMLLLGIGWLLIEQLHSFFSWFESSIPSYLNWLNWLLWPLAILMVLFTLGGLFSTIINFISAPFNDKLCERVSVLLNHAHKEDTKSTLTQQCLRSFKRETCKVKYSIPRLILGFSLFFIPVIGQTLAPILWFLLGAWLVSIEYNDYFHDNQERSFKESLQTMNQHKLLHLGFGTTVMWGSMIPFLNLIVMPTAVCGATAMCLYLHE